MSLLIKGVQIVDGLGGEPYKADVLVQQNIVSAIGEFRGRAADTIIDGHGDYLAPGFIDVHSTSDHYLSILDNPSQEGFLKQGVTTTIGGYCGGSLAPLLYGTLESLGKWANVGDVNVDWHSLAEFREAMSRIKLGVNFGTLVGYNTIRYAVLAGRAKSNESEKTILKKVLTEAMDEGAYGLSIGLEDIYSRTIPKREIEELVMLLRPYQGIYGVHLRNEREGIVEAVSEVIRTAERTGVTTVISHFRPVKKYEKEFTEALEMITKTDAPVYFDTGPYPVSVMPLYTFLPLWAQKKSYEEMIERVKSRSSVEIIKKEWGRFNSDAIYIYGAPGHEYLVGKSLREISEDLETDPRAAMIYLMRETGLKATLLLEDVNENRLRTLLRHPKALISSNGNSVASGEFMNHKRAFDTFPKFLKEASMRPRFSLPDTVASITAKPARFFNLYRRGIIEEGGMADMVLLTKNDYKVREVIVGGGVASTREGRGRVLRHEK